jgi:hypothetical protein
VVNREIIGKVWGEDCGEGCLRQKTTAGNKQNQLLGLGALINFILEDVRNKPDKPGL